MNGRIEIVIICFFLYFRKNLGGQALQASASNFRPPFSHHQPHVGSTNTHNNHTDNDEEGVDVVGLDSSDTYSHHSKYL